MQSSPQQLLGIVGFLVVFISAWVPGLAGQVQGMNPTTTKSTGILGRFRRAPKPPAIPSAPLDLNENIHHTLDELNQILGSLGGASSGLVMGLTDISITDCALSVKGEDLNTITCADFIDKLSDCDSLTNIIPLLQQAKGKYKKKPNATGPCFANKRSGGRKGNRRS